MNQIDQYNALKEGKTSTSSIAGRAHLRKRFPGIDAMIGRAVGEMADYYHGNEAPDFHTCADIRPNLAAGLGIATSWNVWIVATGTQIKRIDESGTLRMPVIPDEHNPRAGGVIKATDKPWDFKSMAEAERYAELAEMEMRKDLRELLGAK